MEKALFPSSFIWGTATAAQQIEGGSCEDGRSPSIWDEFCRLPGKIAGGGDVTIASDHYHRWQEDFDLIQEHHLRHYRFSLSWPRLMREGITPNQKGIDFYNRLIDGLSERGITPWVTLYHWDLPQALQERGGWTSRDILGWFSDYADLALSSFGDRVTNWIILNEPSVTSLIGHGYGFYAPGLKDEQAYAASVHHQNLVIGQVARQAKSMNSAWQIGSAYTCLRTPPENAETPPEAAKTMHAFWNGNFFDPLFLGRYPQIQEHLFTSLIHDQDMETCRAPLDFIGLQHYSSIRARHDPDWLCSTFFGARPADKPVTGIGWPVEPEEFYGALRDFDAAYGGRIPVIITENGAAYPDPLSADGSCPDPERIAYFRAYIQALHDAMQDGVDVRGYFVWSLLDNFEWADGYAPRFGLVHVDYADHCKRTPKSSLKWFSHFIRNGYFL